MRLSEVVLHVQDMQKQVEFYSEILGLDVIAPPELTDYSGETWVELDTGACSLCLRAGGNRQYGADALALPHHEQPHRLREPLQRRLALVVELEALARAQVHDDPRDQDLSRLGPVADTGGELDRGAEVVVALRDGLARVEANADTHFGPGQLALEL